MTETLKIILYIKKQKYNFILIHLYKLTNFNYSKKLIKCYTLKI